MGYMVYNHAIEGIRASQDYDPDDWSGTIFLNRDECLKLSGEEYSWVDHLREGRIARNCFKDDTVHMVSPMGAIWEVFGGRIIAGCRVFNDLNEVKSHYLSPDYCGTWKGYEQEAVAFAEMLLSIYNKKYS